MYIIGGFAVDEESKVRGYRNDVYKSVDGETWDVVSHSNGWSGRMNHAVVVSGEKMYLFGGMQNGITYFDDMWESDDGATWIPVEGGTLPGKRSSFASTVDDNGIIYLLGGSYPDAKPDSNGAFDNKYGPGWEALWSYNPGGGSPSWTQLSAPRWRTSLKAEFSLGYIDDSCIMLPGKANTSPRFSRNNSTYSTEIFEGGSWRTDSVGPPIPPRYSYSSVIFDIDGIEYLFVIGGLSDNGPENDVYIGNFGGIL